MNRTFASSLVALFVVVACGGTTTVIDGGVDGSSADASSKDGSVSDAPVYDSGGGACDGGACGFGLECCGDQCVNQTNDPNNCGGCGTVCSGSKSMCLGGSCQAQTCQPACGDGFKCCDLQGPGPSGPPKCVAGQTCPVGCPSCG